MGQEQVQSSAKSIKEGYSYLAPEPAQQKTSGNPLHAWQKHLLAKILHAFGDPPVNVMLWNGLEIPSRHGNGVARVFIRDFGALLKLAFDHELYFGELYSDQRVEVEGKLLDFLEAVFRVWQFPTQEKVGKRLLSHLYDARRNTLIGSRRNIQHHYDIGNDFYKLWLDERMLYTCAYFPSPNASLEDAQLAKMDHVSRKLRLQPGETVVEAGCGWGALAMHMAKYYGVKVRAYNISKEQVAYARQRARNEGLDGQVEFVEDDYRNVDGKFDVFVSVGMLEHVGTENYSGLGAVIDRCLKDDGRGLIHTIGMNYPRPMDAWAERHIFPGANPPSLAQMMHIFEPYDFSVLDVENLRLHYARTLEHWLDRFDGKEDEVRDMFDEKFVRMWRLYLAGSLTTFKTGDLQLFQVSFARADNNQIPWTRQYMYQSKQTSGGAADEKL
jgi:cyclopropane-fatty-acyl-phospholipid synthase